MQHQGTGGWPGRKERGGSPPGCGRRERPRRGRPWPPRATPRSPGAAAAPGSDRGVADHPGSPGISFTAARWTPWAGLATPQQPILWAISTPVSNDFRGLGPNSCVRPCRASKTLVQRTRGLQPGWEQPGWKSGGGLDPPGRVGSSLRNSLHRSACSVFGPEKMGGRSCVFACPPPGSLLDPSHPSGGVQKSA